MAGDAGTPNGWSNYKRFYVLIAYILLLQAFTGPHLPWKGFFSKQQAKQQASAPTGVASTPADLYFKPMADLVEPHGYALEEHFVTTPDGYILRLFRIEPRQSACSDSSSSNSNSSCSQANTCAPQCLPADGSSCTACLPTTASASSSNSTTSSRCRPLVGGVGSSRQPSQRPLIFMQHALMDSSAGWLLLGPGKALALQLSDAGFDVWLGNSRGNRYSRNHSTLLPEDPAFWRYSWDEMAQQDLPASIEYSMQASGQQSLVYIGYSQGTMIGLAALSSQPRLAASISLAILMAPVAFTTAMTSPAFKYPAALNFDSFALSKGWGEWGSFQKATADAMQPVCRRFPWFCLGYLTTFCGKNPSGNVQHDMVPLIFQHLPAGTSVQVMAHWAQGIRRASTTHLHRFDYGSDCSPSSSSNASSSGTGSCASSTDSASRRCNQQVYGQAVPPKYDLSAITTPVALFTGGRDTISSVADIELLKRVLQPGVLVHHHHQPDYAHLDFELGTDAPHRVYPELLDLAVRFGSSQQ